MSDTSHAAEHKVLEPTRVPNFDEQSMYDELQNTTNTGFLKKGKVVPVDGIEMNSNVSMGRISKKNADMDFEGGDDDPHDQEQKQ